MNNPFRKMIYENEQEQEKVLGKLMENSFIKEKRNEKLQMIKQVDHLLDLLLESASQ